MTQETQIQGKKTSGQRSRWSVDELMRIKRETRPSTSNPPQRKPPSSPAPTQNVPSSFLKNQPLPPKEIRRREQRQALLKSNVSSVLFPDGNVSFIYHLAQIADFYFNRIPAKASVCGKQLESKTTSIPSESTPQKFGDHSFGARLKS